MSIKSRGHCDRPDSDNSANTPPDDTLIQPDIDSLPLLHRGKVRNVYIVDNHRLLIVASDRLSAFDIVLTDPIPGKGRILTAMSRFWFERTSAMLPNHLLPVCPSEVLTANEASPALLSRSAVVVKTKPLPVEAIVRGYLAGSGWNEYRHSGSVCGIPLPQGLPPATQLPEPIFTPSTKAAAGEHDVNITFDECAKIIGADLARKVRDASIRLYRECAQYALQCGIIIADTKMEFGLTDDGRLLLIDELLTPDSSRFWPMEEKRAGDSPPSFDKQFIRDYLENIHWNKKPPAPRLPADIIAKTARKYQCAQELLMRFPQNSPGVQHGIGQ